MSNVEYMLVNPNTSDWDSGWDGPGWYYWDETGSSCVGPFESAKIANEKLREYARGLNIER